MADERRDGQPLSAGVSIGAALAAALLPFTPLPESLAAASPPPAIASDAGSSKSTEIRGPLEELLLGTLQAQADVGPSELITPITRDYAAPADLQPRRRLPVEQKYVEQTQQPVDTTKPSRTVELLGGPGASPGRLSEFQRQYSLFKAGLEETAKFDFKEAEGIFTEIIDSYETPKAKESERARFMLARAYTDRGNTRVSLGELNKALVDYSCAIEYAPDEADFWLNRAIACEQKAEQSLTSSLQFANQWYKEALEDYEHALVLKPSDPRLYANTGEILTLLEDFDAALEKFRQASALAPSNVAYKARIALLDAQLGDVRRSHFIINDIVRRSPDYWEMVLAKSMLDWNVGRFAEGAYLYDISVQENPLLLDDRHLVRDLRWPPYFVEGLRNLRMAGEKNRALEKVLFFETPQEFY
ncbi:unnamed protein product [Vitrella brassicaformis CCMP3155]|uniref:Uncharacterized protein n=1 Tax=Vitrella brassicaformis (strain CCMP3155) TaxID=1169540 RepID=A0A0G4F1G1_VITBC|nr:unnamed protein product [Vitrella brassicaformis CCMP3155]|eukprot:CEM05563.1 unnamed protein product [Vitrella brassicaformis CCMP3155]